jgi:hypothetical protein
MKNITNAKNALWRIWFSYVGVYYNTLHFCLVNVLMGIISLLGRRCGHDNKTSKKAEN